MKLSGRVVFSFFIIGLLVCSATDLFAFKFDFTTVSDIVDNIKKNFGKMESYQANFTIVSDKGGRTSHQAGTIKYKAHNKLYIEFSQPI